MGKHGKHKDKKHKKEKKHKRKRNYSSSSDSTASDEWIEKEAASSKNSEPEDKLNRDGWMSLGTEFSSFSNLDKQSERKAKKRLEREGEIYKPGECSRELNPFWKDGGDGLPKFQKPTDDFDVSSYKKSINMPSASTSGWRKSKNEHRETKETKAVVEETEYEGGRVLSNTELNFLASKILKAEIKGDMALVAELKAKMERANQMSKTDQRDEAEILTQTDSKGYSRPLKMQSDYGGHSWGGKNKKRKVDTHSDGQRVCYFPDDDKFSLQQMFENEKYNTVEESNREFMNIAQKMRKNDDLDDVFTDNIRQKESDGVVDKRNKDKAINEHRQTNEALDSCVSCLQSEKMSKHLLVTTTDTIYLSLPNYEPLAEHHCTIVPIRHVSCSTQLDENEWSEMKDFRQAITRMFKEDDQDVIFFETAMFLHRHPHMVLHCIPVDQEIGSLAPIYFKKAIEESENEWTSNKKLVSLTGRDVRRAIPKGLPYFAVSFGMDEGFAHVIEDQRLFPSNFAQEIIGGMLDLHHSKWRKPKLQKFEQQKERASEFSKKWNPFDFTK